MAEVFLGRVNGPSGFERPVVLKRILPHLARQPAFVQMFLDEARIVARMRHPNVVHVHELVQDEGELFLVMEYLEGESVASLTRRLIARGETLGPSLAAYLVAEACAGLHAAHELHEDGFPLDVVHRDVSPQNLFVTFDGGTKLLDFGIAKSHGRLTRTETGELKGKLEYMSPEQCLTEDLDRRSDVFSLGVVLYELLTLRRLFKRPTPLASMKAITEEPLVAPSRINAACPPELDAICLRALQRDRNARYATAAEMRRELVAVVHAAAEPLLPEERLHAVMVRLFADRKQEKEDMLRRVRGGSFPTAIPASEADDSIEIPVLLLEPIAAVVAEHSVALGAHGSVSGSVHGAPTMQSPRRRRTALGVLVLAAAVLGVATFGLARARDTNRPPSSVAERAAAAPVASVAEAAPPRSVRLDLDSVPAGASVSIDGEARGITPLELTLPAASRTVVVELSKPGFAVARSTLSLETDQRLAPSLTAVRVSTRRGPGAAHAPDPLKTKW